MTGIYRKRPPFHFFEMGFRVGRQDIYWVNETGKMVFDIYEETYPIEEYR